MSRRDIKCTCSILSFLCLDKVFTDVAALRDMHIKVPQAVRVGDEVTLACDYDLEQVALYTIKWYRDDVEFYRFVPKESPPSREFVVEHVNVDVFQNKTFDEKTHWRCDIYQQMKCPAHVATVEDQIVKCGKKHNHDGNAAKVEAAKILDS
ncbi:hypothetical protein FQA39_LY10819 [Lamprigera yunnana]|nr:hypothetical protein FQA39_LY10819 [Lamprigera yunnana]